MAAAKIDRIYQVSHDADPYRSGSKVVYHSTFVYEVEARVMFSTNNPAEPFKCRQATVFPVPEDGFDLRKVMDVLDAMFPDMAHVDFRVTPKMIRE